MSRVAQSEPPVVLFDGVCNLCSGFVRFAMARESGRVLRFAAMQSPRGQELLRRHGLPLTNFESFAFLEDGAVHLKSGGFLRIVRYLRRPWPWLAAGRVLPRAFRDWVYDRIARNRYRLFGKRAACMVPAPELLDRFLT
ncbi:MAG TPA: DCC1-like thiol-disulfide oxidoreductase family protein [Stellaceae bacterium]|nr:DCC1-like thiol-disulfide oxidoreductase family protein [Stellaceae bacterium]